MNNTEKKRVVSCPLCKGSEMIEDIETGDRRSYYHCGFCFLIFVDPAYLLSPAEEKRRYETHNNSIENEGYVRFLLQAVNPTMPFLTKRMSGLDYGCGPGPTLSKLLKQREINCEDYDPFFRQHSLNKKYDFIFATECFEHFSKPEAEIESIKMLLKPEGLLTIMTVFWSDLAEFDGWYYTKDTTHVSFYHRKTIDYICRFYGFELIWQDYQRVVILRSIQPAESL